MSKAGVKRFLNKNGSTMLSVAAMIGVAVTGYLWHRAAKKADDHAFRMAIEDRYEESVENSEPVILNDEAVNDILENRKEYSVDAAKEEWKAYALACASGVFTCGLIFTANRIDMAKIAGLSAALYSTKRKFDLYRKENIKAHGVDEDIEFRKHIQEEVSKHCITPEKPDGGDYIKWYDPICEEVVWLTERQMYEARTKLACQLLNENVASWNTYRDYMGLPRTHKGAEYGWDMTFMRSDTVLDWKDWDGDINGETIRYIGFGDWSQPTNYWLSNLADQEYATDIYNWEMAAVDGGETMGNYPYQLPFI